MIVLYREIMMLRLRAGYCETGAVAPNSAKFRGGGCRGSQNLTNGGGLGEGLAIIIYFLSDKNIHFLEFLR